MEQVRTSPRFRFALGSLAALLAAAWACSSNAPASDGARPFAGASSGGTSAQAGGATAMGGALGGSALVAGSANASGGAAGSANASGGAAGSMTSGGGAGGVAGSSGSGMSPGGSAGHAGSAGSAVCGAPQPVVFSKNIRVNDDTGNGNQAEVTLATGPGGLAAAAWGDSRAERTCTFSVTKDGGLTWSKNVAIKNVSGEFVGDPAVGIDAGGTIYAVCQEYVDVGKTGNIRLMTSSNQGDSWSEVRSIQNAPDKPWVGGGDSAGTLFVSWLGNPGGIKRSTDHGQMWGPTQSLGNIIHGTAIVTGTSGLVHVPYNLDSNNNQLRYLRSIDGGSSWEKARDLIPDMGAFCFDCSPRQHPIVGAASDPTGKTVAITWTSRMPAGEGDDDVWLLFSKDGGGSWSKPLRVNDNAQRSRQFQSWVAVDSCGRVHVAWTDLRNGQNEVWYARSADPTRGFEPNLQVTDGRGSAQTEFLGDYKGLVVQGSDVLVVWQDTRRDSGDIYFARAQGAAAP